MALHANSLLLIQSIESLSLLDGRFSDMHVVNVGAGTRRGVLSLVFEAFDRDTGQKVALKFFDPQRLGDVYRLTCFRREHEILQRLLHVDSALHLASGLQRYDLPIPGHPGVVLPCEYFALEWLDRDLDDYFLRQESFSAEEKLHIFRKIVSAVSLLHANFIFHRDLKRDNLRLNVVNGELVVVPIDMGTAAQIGSPAIQPTPYVHPAGASGYAAPEARCGFAGLRSIARFTDLYALGCMLFELFNKHHYYAAFETRNKNWQALFAVLAAGVNFADPEPIQVRAWESGISRLAGSFATVPIDGAGTCCPPGVAGLLNELLSSLTDPDYRKRPRFAWIHRKLSSAICLLRNERMMQQRIAMKKEMRRRRMVRLAEREARLEAFLRQKLGG